MTEIIKNNLNLNLINIIRNYLTRSKLEYKNIYSNNIEPSIEFQYFYFNLRKILGNYEFIVVHPFYENIYVIYYNFIVNNIFKEFEQTHDNLKNHICYYNNYVGLYININDILYKDLMKCNDHKLKNRIIYKSY